MIGCYIDVDAATIRYSFNGSVESPNGVAFSGNDTARVHLGVSPCISLCDGFSCDVRLGPSSEDPVSQPFVYDHPAGSCWHLRPLTRCCTLIAGFQRLLQDTCPWLLLLRRCGVVLVSLNK